LLNLLLDVAGKMWEQRTVAIDLNSINIREQERSESDSLYNMVLSENIILEEATHLYSTRKFVRFLYDELMEYAIARSWVNTILSTGDERAAMSRLLQEAAEALGAFPTVLGAVLFLDKMLKRGGQLINDLIVRAAKLDELVLSSQQTSIVVAFESVDFAHADDELMSVVEKLEPIVRQELRERLAAVILKILEAHPDRKHARQYVHQLLEVEKKGDVIKPAKMRLAYNPLAFNNESPSLKPADSPLGLPPARYHYSEDTKINAIGLLVQLKDTNDYDVIDDGIRKLGRSDLHNALQALQYVDVGNDELVFRTITSYMKAPQPEYRVYCAWLLRERYGKEPARFLTKLLTDSETRVHRYTVNLFEKRLIERELIEEILKAIRWAEVELKPWHLTNFVRLLGKRQQFYPPESEEKFGPMIVASLSSLLVHSNASLRLEIYRTITASPSVNLLDLKEKMKQDTDVYIRSLSEKL
jgi:hypothetical protein